MSLRRVQVVIRNLPRGSAMSRKADPHQWGPTDYLLALAVDVLQAGNWQRAGNAKASKPKPLKRPGDMSPEKQEELGARGRAMRARQQQQRGDVDG